MRKVGEEGTGQAMSMVFLALCLSSASTFASADQNRRRPQPSPPHEAAKDRFPSSVSIGRTSSAVFPLYGNVYPNGLYFASLRIGDPPRPYFLDVDTGSDLTWVQCDAPCVSCSKGPHPLYKPEKDKLVPCVHPICDSLQAVASTPSHTGEAQRPHCDSPNDQCDYEVEYADQGSSRGVLISDTFSMHFVNGSLLRPRLAFGCGYDQQLYGNDAPSPTDGVLGLGLGKSSIMSQLREHGLTRNVMGHCLGRRGGGFLFFGDDLVPTSGVSWTPMSGRGLRKYYSPGPANLFLGRQLLGKNFEVIFDSGSSYTYFSSRPYEIFLTLMMRDLSGKQLKVASDDRTLPLCWRGAKPFKSIGEARKYFKPLTMAFSQGKRALLAIPPENYLILTKHGSLCLGVLNGTEVGLKDLNIIGDISVQDVMVVYDNEKEQIGWARANCERFPRSAGSSALPSPPPGFPVPEHLPSLRPSFHAASGSEEMVARGVSAGHPHHHHHPGGL
ncbi:unnamed protein product [Spirodela intermedia]|uniref:Aspartic proteinase Asp1 n=1 Tax=Spirodela intermedia TaxID=51605 RepID=A0A7I8L4E8_SPIIN|nr:unnamed protein product [Spirodela intermedia]